MDESYLSGGPVDGIFAALAENFLASAFKAAGIRPWYR